MEGSVENRAVAKECETVVACVAVVVVGRMDVVLDVEDPSGLWVCLSWREERVIESNAQDMYASGKEKSEAVDNSYNHVNLSSVWTLMKEA